MRVFRQITVLVVAMSLGRWSVADANPHVSQADARAVALARVPGTVVHEKLKHKKKGHDLYYFKIKPRDASAKTDMIKKVEVDSESGQIVKIKDVAAKKSKSGD
jgi:uncharacterized membrane protein YkoI